MKFLNEIDGADNIRQDENHRFVTDVQKLYWNNKVDQAELDDRVKTDVPANAKFTDTTYSHPDTHPYSMIAGRPTKLSEFINDVETYRKAATPQYKH